MAEHGVDGAFLQRFAEQCQPGQEHSIRRLRDEVGQLVRDAAEKEGRVFAIMCVFGHYTLDFLTICFFQVRCVQRPCEPDSTYLGTRLGSPHPQIMYP